VRRPRARLVTYAAEGGTKISDKSRKPEDKDHTALATDAARKRKKKQRTEALKSLIVLRRYYRRAVLTNLL